MITGVTNRRIVGSLPRKQMLKILLPATLSLFPWSSFLFSSLPIVLCLLLFLFVPPELLLYYGLFLYRFCYRTHIVTYSHFLCFSTVAPTVRIVSPTGILREGDSLSLTCSITGNPL